MAESQPVFTEAQEQRIREMLTGAPGKPPVSSDGAFTADQESRIVQVATYYHQKEIEEQVEKGLRGVRRASALVGYGSVVAVVGLLISFVGLFFYLPRLASDRLKGEMTDLSSQVQAIVREAGTAKQQASAASIAGQEAQKAADDANKAAGDIRRTNVNTVRTQVKELESIFAGKERLLARGHSLLMASQLDVWSEWKDIPTSWGSDMVTAAGRWRIVGDMAEIIVRVTPVNGSNKFPKAPLGIDLPVGLIPLFETSSTDSNALWEDVGSVLYVLGKDNDKNNSPRLYGGRVLMRGGFKDGKVIGGTLQPWCEIQYAVPVGTGGVVRFRPLSQGQFEAPNLLPTFGPGDFPWFELHARFRVQNSNSETTSAPTTIETTSHPAVGAH